MAGAGTSGIAAAFTRSGFAFGGAGIAASAGGGLGAGGILGSATTFLRTWMGTGGAGGNAGAFQLIRLGTRTSAWSGITGASGWMIVCLRLSGAGGCDS